jgi:hypothetical protein
MCLLHLFYRKTAATGVPEVQTLATLKADLGLVGTNSGDVIAAALSKVDDINITPRFSVNCFISCYNYYSWAGTLADARITSAATWNTALMREDNGMVEL